MSLDTLPATKGALRSLVTAFLNFFPCLMEFKRAPRLSPDDFAGEEAKNGGGGGPIDGGAKGGGGGGPGISI